jgi:hypothetical protein
LEGLAIENVGIFYGQCFYLLAKRYIVWSIGTFCGHFVYFFPFWYALPRKIWQPCAVSWVLSSLTVVRRDSLRLGFVIIEAKKTERTLCNNKSGHYFFAEMLKCQRPSLLDRGFESRIRHLYIAMQFTCQSTQVFSGKLKTSLVLKSHFDIINQGNLHGMV